MIEIRIHGRGGHGAVVASKVLGNAFFKDGKYVQSFPFFGIERRGAPVSAFLRVDGEPIRIRCNIYRPDHVIVLDPTLIDLPDVKTGLKHEGFIIINSEKKPKEYRDQFPMARIVTVNASRIALDHGLGTTFFPIVNTTILGAFIKVTGLLSLSNLEEAIKEEIQQNPQTNINACRQAYETCQVDLSHMV